MINIDKIFSKFKYDTECEYAQFFFESILEDIFA